MRHLFYIVDRHGDYYAAYETFWEADWYLERLWPLRHPDKTFFIHEG